MSPNSSSVKGLEGVPARVGGIALIARVSVSDISKGLPDVVGGIASKDKNLPGFGVAFLFFEVEGVAIANLDLARKLHGYSKE